MKRLAWVLLIGFVALLVSTAPAIARGPHDKSCVAEIRAAGDWGKTINPGKAVFVSGTEGTDVIEHIAEGVVFCGLGGNDIVELNEGWFYGGEGIDTTKVNDGTVDGGPQTDVVEMNNGTFMGRSSRDVVHVNNGLFNGGSGSDLVQDANNGTCIDVEQGC